MSIRPPRILAPSKQSSPYDALEHEMMAERAASLSRIASRFEEALAAWRRLEDAAKAGGSARDIEDGSIEEARARALDEAAQALWALVVQREALGLPGTERLMREYDVPRVLRARLGIVRKPAL
ncbi:DUF6665 family protein [Afifella marina]|uniref:Uncharacterized protein n=1 Tax=Afifella marina DSM 2698 TaxID=1120955 RepID=A0A1G5P1L5_AFIMA|nr:DUF6665 family protein [Afifella marina]MBK1624263.1 hypothetical protein [Afifella marina DSM 2698]MBK1627996.1 hypothetical protein [Afifella marina]MBK5918190.1 hypothetical protein [Afifella marina]RAI19233.1 hypothetical protein CH311_13065 [Afifella marina DSM 2698]SCZ43436.1 hypothetical protein SAMN03080610_03056 [Afifella marina DSM 2698]